MGKFLIVNTSFLGDVLLTGALCRALKMKYPDSRIVFMVNKPFYEAARYLEGVDEVLIYDKMEWNKGLKGFFRFVFFHKNFYKEKIKAAFVIYGNERGICLAKFWNVKEIYSDAKGLVRFLVKNKKINYREWKHVQDRNLALLELYTRERIEPLPIIYHPPLKSIENINNLWKEKGLKEATKVISLCTVSKLQEKDMPIETCIELLSYFKKNGKVALFLGAGEIARKYVKELYKRKVTDFIDLVDQTSIAELAVVLKKSSLVISVDTGTLHLSCAMGTPLIALFYIDDKEHLEKWAPKEFYTHKLLTGKNITTAKIINSMNNLLL